MKKLLLLSVFLILGVLLFAACGGGEETSGDSADSEGTFAPVSSSKSEASSKSLLSLR